MNIMFITPELLYPAHSGGKKAMLNRMIALAKTNKIFLVSFYEDETSIDYAFFKQYCEKTLFIKKKNFIKSIFSCIFLPYMIANRTSHKIRKKIQHFYDTNSIDRIVIEMPQMYYNVKKIKCYKVIESHNVEYKCLISVGKTQKSIMKKIIYFIDGVRLFFYEKKIYKKNLKSNTYYTFITNDDMTFYLNKFKIQNYRCKYIPQVMENHLSKNNENTKCIGFFGNMAYGPNNYGALWLIENVMPCVLKQIKECKLYIVGRGASQDLICKNSQNIIVTGEVKNIDEYYDKVSIVLIPIFHGGGIKVKLVEAASYGKIILSTSFGLSGSEFDDKSVIVSDNAEEFADKICKILIDYNKYDSYSKNAYSIFMKKYEFNNVLNEYSNFICKNELDDKK